MNGPFGNTLYKFIARYNQTDIKNALPAILLSHLLLDLVSLVDAYLPIGRQVEACCWKCVEIMQNPMVTEREDD